MVIITVNTALDSKEKIEKVIKELQAIVAQKEKFSAWKPTSKQEKKPSASDILKDVDKIPASAEDKMQAQKFKKIQLEKY